MNSSWGKQVNLSLFGESHGEGIGIVIQGLQPGIALDMEAIQEEMARRMPGQNLLSTQRKETDTPRILSGFFEGYTTGAPLAIVIENQDTHSKDYSQLKNRMRPGHADYPGYVRYNGFNDYRGGGHFSGRLTAPLVFAGAVAKQILAQKGVSVAAHITQIGRVKGRKADRLQINEQLRTGLLQQELPVMDATLIEPMKNEILAARQAGDSVGGKIECMILGLKPGIGNPFFDSLESTIAHLAFSVPSVKGISFGAGFEFASMRGSEANDAYQIEEGHITTVTNHNGGITGGITNGMPVTFEVVIKPTPSISKAQQTIDLGKCENTTLEIIGRHDPCIVQRAVVVIEAIAALSILEQWRD